MKAKLRSSVAALVLLAPAAATFVAMPLSAQAAQTLQIQSLQLNANDGLQPGSRLRISVQGTPGGRATVNFGKTDIDVALREGARGTYTGTYTVRGADRIDPTSVMTVSLVREGETQRHSFSYPPSFQALATSNATERDARSAARREDSREKSREPGESREPRVAAAPVAPAAHVAAAAPRIERFRALPVERLEAGRELRYRVQGLPGAVVTLEIPGVVSGIAMRETSPGVYEAAYTVRGRDDLDAFDVAVATLRSGNRWVMSRLQNAYVHRADNRPPTVTGLLPGHGEVVPPDGRVTLGADFADDSGSGVDPESVRILLSGRDVTADSRITPRRFTYRGDLPPGHYVAEVTARDRAGNIVDRSWSFDVGVPERVGSAMYDDDDDGDDGHDGARRRR